MSEPHSLTYYFKSWMKPIVNAQGEKTKENQNKYNLRSKQKEGNPSTSNQPKKLENSAKAVASTSKENEEKNINL